MFITMSDLSQAAETTSTEKLVVEQALGREIDLLLDTAREWKAQYGSGSSAIISLIRGNPELAELKAYVERLRATVKSADLTNDGRARLNVVMSKVDSSLKPSDIMIYVGGVTALIVGQAVIKFIANSASDKAKKTFWKQQEVAAKKKRKKSKVASVAAEEGI